jgi:hypothetical protein
VTPLLDSALRGMYAAARVFEAKAASVSRASVQMTEAGASQGGPGCASTGDDVVRDLATLDIPALQFQANVAAVREADKTCGTILDLLA